MCSSDLEPLVRFAAIEALKRTFKRGPDLLLGGHEIWQRQCPASRMMHARRIIKLVSPRECWRYAEAAMAMHPEFLKITHMAEFPQRGIDDRHQRHGKARGVDHRKELAGAGRGFGERADQRGRGRMGTELREVRPASAVGRVCYSRAAFLAEQVFSE